MASLKNNYYARTQSISVTLIKNRLDYTYVQVVLSIFMQSGSEYNKSLCVQDILDTQ